MYKKPIIIGVTVVTLLLLIVFLLPSSTQGCQGKTDKNSPCHSLWTKYDSIQQTNFREDHRYQQKDKLEKVSIYVENSLSIDAYLYEYTQFCETVSNYIENAKLSSKKVSTYYINNKVIPYTNSSRFGRDGLKPSSIPSDGDRGHTELSDVIDTVLTKNEKGEVSVLFSDFVPSPNGGSMISIKNFISNFSTKVSVSIRKKLTDRPELSIVLCRYISNFSGKYFFADNSHVIINNGRRPFYALLIGDYYDVAKLMRESNITKGAEATFSCFNPDVTIPYRMESPSLKPFSEGHPNFYKHLMLDEKICDKIRQDTSGNMISIKLKMDLSCLPLQESYMADVSKYRIQKSGLFDLVRIEKTDGEYSHTLILRNHPNANIGKRTKVIIELAKDENLWKDKYSTDDDKSIQNNTLRTLGIESFRNAISGAFGNQYAKFTLMIN